MAAWSSGVMAQQAGSISGTVYDADFDVPLADATVTIAETGATATTGSQGNYTFGAVEPGRYTLIFGKSGFVRYVESDVLVQPGSVTGNIDASLGGDFTEMEEFVVQDIQIGAGTEEQLLDLRIESPALIDSVGAELMSQAGASDAAAGLRLVAGATVSSDDKPIVRGLPDRFVSSQLNGVRLPSADEETRAIELDQFSADVIESIQVTKTFTPDQQGDASGGAVNIVLKGVPTENFISFSSGTEFNSQVARQNDQFLSYRGGGLSFFGIDRGRRNQPDFGDPAPALGTQTQHAPSEYSFDIAGGLRHEFDNGVAIGGLISLFYERDATFTDNAFDDELLAVAQPDGSFRMIPAGINVGGEDRTTSLFDVTEGTEEVQFGGLATVGLESEWTDLNFIFFQTRTITDTATLAEDVRGRKLAESSPDFADPSIGLLSFDMPFRRSFTIKRQERLIESVQFNGRHTLPLPQWELGPVMTLLEPELDWTYAISRAESREPDERIFGEVFAPESGLPALGGENVIAGEEISVNSGNAQRSWEQIEENSDQYAINLKFPFELWHGEVGFVKVGIFDDQVDRGFTRNTFNNFGTTLREFTDEDFQDTTLTDTPGLTVSQQDIASDVSFDGTFDVSATYWMADLPVTTWLRLIGGMRFEETDISVLLTDIDPAAFAVDPVSGAADPLLDGAGNRRIDPVSGRPLGDVVFSQKDVLPAIAMVIEPLDGLTFRASYTETVARQTFRELSVALQREFLGGDQFVGNPNLQMAAVDNYDLRLDYRPTEGSFFSVSWFRKEIEGPIELVTRGNTRLGGFFFPQNFPEGELEGIELEARQHLGEWWEALEGLSIGANATFIDSEVTLPPTEIPVATGERTRQMTNTPERLMNFFLTYQIEQIGTEIGIFYTITGESLVSGADPGNAGAFSPSIFAREFDTLNLTISQRIGEHIKLKFAAKNLTDPEIETFHRSSVTPETTRTSTTKGIDFSFGISAEFTF